MDRRTLTPEEMEKLEAMIAVIPVLDNAFRLCTASARSQGLGIIARRSAIALRVTLKGFLGSGGYREGPRA
jgi:hypothetical protein